MVSAQTAHQLNNKMIIGYRGIFLELMSIDNKHEIQQVNIGSILFTSKYLKSV